jgi:DNA modification methylase
MEVRLGSCLDPVSGLGTLPDKSVDVVITDPPYEAEAHTKGRRTKRNGGVCVPEIIPFAAITEAQRENAGAEMGRIARRWVLVFCQTEAAQRWASALIAVGLDYVRTMIWVKPDGQPQFTGDRPGVGYESIVVAHPRGRKRWNGGGKCGVFTYGREKGPMEGGQYSGAPHPTTKPLPLISELVSLFSDPGELVCDPYAGSGTTGVACRALGRRFVGWEISPEYHAIATRRIAGERAVLNDAQPELFGAGS